MAFREFEAVLLVGVGKTSANTLWTHPWELRRRIHAAEGLLQSYLPRLHQPRAL